MTLLMEDKIESIEGSFTYCIYKSFNYGVYRFKEKSGDVLIVTGNIQDVDKEAEYILYGCYVDHPKYGIQFNVSGISKQLPSSYEGIIAYLSSDLFKGIGIKKAQKIADRYGLDTLRILRDDADVLKVGHHGSDTSSSKEFLKLVSPSYSLLYISSNKDFPSQAVLSNLRELGSQVYSTYSEGDFAMTVSNDEIIVAHLPQPSFDIALLISIYVLLLLLTWGIKNRYNYGKKRRVKIIALQD